MFIRVKGVADPSPTLHHPSPPSNLRMNHNIINNFKTMIMETKSNLKSSMMAGLCLRVPDGEFIDNSSVINYDQLYAQMMYELRDKETPYWFTNDEVARIQEFNQPFFKVDDLETMISYCFRMPAEEEEGRWMVCSEVFDVLHLQYPMLVGNLSTKIKIGQALKFMGCKSRHTRNGQAYQLLALSA